ncbi:MAG: leucyl/phenylalanyl-tRNA--protein transferase [Deltaproteobacteria bacterium RIFOXYA12_FULL_61_11]|nr:MAG: leucyl/phenylalanyl-tRNA--protein transferase [Deltaproteobacteria bacterium RIFOXYA12_FULL_61_11]
MPRTIFPDPRTGPRDGPLAIGGTLAPSVLLEAYGHGIFPWFGPGESIMWWSPDPRAVLWPGALRLDHGVRRALNSGRWTFSFDRCFERVMKACAMVPRGGQVGTWITVEMQAAYTVLHEVGYAHSVEVFRGQDLVGGLYGLALGAGFFGESMFHLERDASKAALFVLVRRLEHWGYFLLDCQLPTPHLGSLGSVEVPRRQFLAALAGALERPGRRGSWAGVPTLPGGLPGGGTARN